MLGLILPIIIGVSNVYNVTGTWFTFALAFVYIVANVGLYVFYRREHPTEFSWLKHAVVPAIGSIALAVVVYYSLVPLPPWPISAAPFVVLIWLVIGIVVVFVVYRGRRANDLALAGIAMGEAVESRSRRARAGARPAATTRHREVGRRCRISPAVVHRAVSTGRRFTGQGVVVTGAAQGIGLGIVTRFLDEGASVVAFDRNAAALDSVVAGLGPRCVGRGRRRRPTGRIASARSRCARQSSAGST